ncbi:MAG TPA: FtsX-like permease family protein [Burkholderiales bacterium]
MLRLLALLGRRRARGRAALSIAGIALGVALGYGVHLVNRAAVEELAASVRAVAGEADLEVRGGRSGFSEALFPRVARLPGVAWVNPSLELEAGLAGADHRTIRVIGVDALREGKPELLAPDKVLLSPLAAEALGEERLRIVVGQRVVELEVAGVGELKGFAALTDISTAQWRLARLGELNRLDVHLARGASRQQVLNSIKEVLPPGVEVATVDTLEQASGYPSRAYRVNLNVLAMVALFTGGFLVFSAQVLEIARRRGEHALLRVLGLAAPGLARLCLAEAAVLGVLGGIAGVALGYGFARLALRYAGADLGAGQFRGIAPHLAFHLVPAALYVAAGVAVAVIGALLPALDATRTPPARALKAGDEQRMFQRVGRAWPGLGLVAAGAALSQLGPVNGLPVFGYASIAGLLIGAVALMPRVSRWIFERIPFTSSTAFALAVAQLRGAPGQAAVSLAAIVASFSLMAAMAIMVASFRQSLDGWLDAVLPAELYVRSTHAGDTGYLEPGFEERVRGLRVIERAEFTRSARLVLDPVRPALSLLARDRAASAFPVVGTRHERKPGEPPLVWVSEAAHDLYGFDPGSTIELPLNGKRVSVTVGGVVRDYARQHGAIVIERADYVALTGDRRVNDAALWLRPGVTPAQAMEAIRALPGGAQLDLAAPPEIREVSLAIFDRSFAVTYAMEAVAVLVGLFGLSSSLGAIVLARRREFGVLRHLGVTRSQVRAMLAAEGALLSLIGAAAGLVAGGAISLVLVYVVNRQSFNWSMELHPPYLLLLALAATLVALAIVTAVASGREAMGMGPVRAVREDW